MGPGNVTFCECSLTWQRDFADGTKLRVLRWRDYPELSRRTLNITTPVLVRWMCPVMVLPDPLASFSLDLEFLMSGTFSSLIIIFSTILVNVLCPKIHLLRSWTFNSSPLAFFLFLLYSLSLFFLFLLYSLEIFLTLSSKPFTECFGPSLIIFLW